ncbi:MAG: anthrone oxygenase family protein [Phormidesmis sp.]
MPQHLTAQPYLMWKLFAALGCGLIAGAFFAFSSFVMSALAQLEPPQGIAAMQAINITVINPWFMGVFMGTAVVCLFLTIASLLKWHQPGSPYLMAGSLLYLLITFGVTVVFNVPLNNALAKVDPISAEAAKLWAQYLNDWTMWNHVRTVGAIAATVAFILSLCYPAVRSGSL